LRARSQPPCDLSIACPSDQSLAKSGAWPFSTQFSCGHGIKLGESGAAAAVMHPRHEKQPEEILGLFAAAHKLHYAFVVANRGSRHDGAIAQPCHRRSFPPCALKARRSNEVASYILRDLPSVAGSRSKSKWRASAFSLILSSARYFICRPGNSKLARRGVCRDGVSQSSSNRPTSFRFLEGTGRRIALRPGNSLRVSLSV
jgi:hypothetical protein